MRIFVMANTAANLNASNVALVNF